MTWQKFSVLLFWLGAFVLLCIGTTGILIVQTKAGFQKLAGGVIHKEIFIRRMK